MEDSFTSAVSHVFWNGGSPCSGKSTVAAALAGQYGLTADTGDGTAERHVRFAGRSASDRPTAP